MSTEREEESSHGFMVRLRDGGLPTVIHGRDLHIAAVLTIFTILADGFLDISLSSKSFINHANPIAISLIAFILTGLAVLVSFTDEEFLGLLKKLEIYDMLLFQFEMNVYLAILVSITGVIAQTYANLITIGILREAGFYFYLFSFLYMIFSISKLVSTIVSIGSRKAKIAMIRNSD